MISFHGPAYLTGGAVARDIFDETKVPVAYVDLMNVLKEAGANGYKMPEGSSINDFFYGGYAILNKKDEERLSDCELISDGDILQCIPQIIEPKSVDMVVYFVGLAGRNK